MPASEIADLLPADQIRPVRRGTVMRIAVPVLMVLTMVLASVGISYSAYLSHRAESLRLADALIAGIEERIHTQVAGYLAPVARLASLSARLLGTEALSQARSAATETFAIGVIHDNPQIAISSFGDPAGNFLMYVRQPSGAVDTKRIQRDPAGITTRWIRRDPGGTVRTTETVENDGYDPRERPWYIGAARSGGIYWSDVYRFFTSQQPGVTVSVPVTAPDGTLRTVHGMDITLDNLNAFLDGLEPGENGLAIILDGDGRLVAFPNRVAPASVVSGSPTIAELGNAALIRGYDRFRVQGPGRRVLEIDGERYINTVSSLSDVVGRDWWVMVLAPETDFTATVTRSFRGQLLISAGVILLAALLAWRVITQGLAALRDKHGVTERDRAVTRRGMALGKLAACAAALARREAQGATDLTELLSVALGVDRVTLWRVGDGELRCVDTFDRRSGIHSDAAHLKLSAMPELADLLVAPLAIADLNVDPRLREAELDHFTRTGVGSLLSVPVGDETMLWVEGPTCTAASADEALAFLEGAAEVLRPHLHGSPATADGDATPDAEQPQAPPYQRASSTPTATTGSQHRALTATGLDPSRAVALTTRVGSAATDVFAGVSVLVMVLDDAALWGGRGPDGKAGNLLDMLIREVQSAAAELDIEYVKLMGARLVCATGFDAGAEAGARDIARLALELETRCGHALTAVQQRLSYRIGIDVGPALGAGVGDKAWIYNLWGDAVSGADAMAETAAPGTAQVSEACYRLLHREYQFSPRGRYFVPERGETATYVLLGGA
jgi:class 3 adenylate cyclase